MAHQNPSVAGEDSARSKLITTAIILFAEYGTRGISLRKITRDSGQKNDAAVRYHFNGKEGLLDACVEKVAELLLPSQTAAMVKLRKIEEQGDMALRHVIMAEFYPLVSMFESSDFGASCIRFIARMIREEEAFGQRLLVKHFMNRILAIEAYLARMLPNKTPQTIRFHHFLAINAMVNGLADRELLAQLPPVHPENSEFELTADERAVGFIEYLVGGMQSGH